jgi:hypothetical protein
MVSSIDNPRKKKMGRPSVDSEQLNFRLQRDALDGIDAFIAEQDDHPPRTEAVRRIIRDWLIGHGFLPVPK